MNNREFDSFIKDRLKEAGFKSVPNWKAMEDRIDAWELREGLISDQDFDRMVADRLAGLKAGEGSRNWPKLEGLMFGQNKVFRSIFYYQIAGAAVVLLLLLLLFQIKPSGRDAFKSDVIVVHEPKEKNQLIETVQQHEDNASPVRAEDGTAAESQIKEDLSEIVLGIAGNKQNHTILQDPDSNQELFRGSTPVEAGLDQALIIENVASGQNVVPNANMAMAKGHTQSMYQEAAGGERPDRSILISGLLVKSSELACTASRIDGTLWLINDRPINRFSGTSVNGFGLYAFTSPQLSMISSPTDNVLKAPGYFRNEFNLGVGIGLQYRLGNSIMDLGLVYDKLNYMPRITPEYFPSDRSQLYLSQITAQLLTVPFHIKYCYNFQNDFVVYGLAGFSLGLPLHAEYDIEVKENNGLAYLIDDLVTHPTYQSALVKQKDFEKGVLDGAELDKVLYANLDLGVGIEYYFKNNYSFFMEPVYSYFLNDEGFGPNQDKIHRLSLRTGVVGMLN